MSVAEVMPPYSDAAPRLSDRTPPQDMEAEQCVLGAMLMSKDAIADVVEVLRGSDFYRPAHEQVYNAITDLYGRGEPADAVTVSDVLGKRGELLRIGGAPYLHTLLASVPVAANAGYYARDRAREGDPAPARRRLGAHRTDVVRRRGRRRRDRRPGPGRGVLGHRAESGGGLQTTVGADAADARRDGGHRISRGRAVRGADRFRRARRADQRSASRPDGHRGRETGGWEVNAGPGSCPVGVDQERSDLGDLQPGDEPDRDHHAAAVGRGDRSRWSTSAAVG